MILADSIGKLKVQCFHAQMPKTNLANTKPAHSVNKTEYMIPVNKMDLAVPTSCSFRLFLHS